MQYKNFDLSIEDRGEQYIARVLESPSGQAEERFDLPFTEEELERLSDSIEIAVLRSVGRIGRRVGDPSTERLRAFGKKLFETVFKGGVRDAYVVSLSSAETEEKGLRIRLRLAPEVSQLPWELLFDASRQEDFLLLSKWTPIVRYVELPTVPRTTVAQPPLRILLTLASPRNWSPLDIAKERAIIRQSLAVLEKRNLIEVDTIHGPNTLDKLRRQLEKKTYHVLHVVAHGDYDSEHQEGILLFENVLGREHAVGAEQLYRLVRNHRSVRLMVLNSCKGTVQAESSALTSMALALVKAGVPSVIAMQFEVADENAIIFAQGFYHSLANNRPIDTATSEARLALALREPDSIAWAAPVLFMRSEIGTLFETAMSTSATDLKHGALLSIASLRREMFPSAISMTGSEGLEESPPSEPALSIQEVIESYDMIWIPSGSFSMGGKGAEAQPYELPVHEVDLNGYYIARYPVTCLQYQRFVIANPSHSVPVAPATWAAAQPFSWDAALRKFPKGRDRHPVTLVSWYDAVAYCNWLSSMLGFFFRLPTEAEWEKAAAGPDRFLFPWGDEWEKDRCNVAGDVGDTTPVGFYSPQGDSGYGIADMAGNVWEWTTTLFKPYPYDRADGREDQTAVGRRVLRGGSWIYTVVDARCAARNPLHDPGEVGIDGGFRLVLEFDQQAKDKP